MNTKVRRKVRGEMGTTIALDQIDQNFGIQVEGKIGQVVMVFANAKGRKVVGDLWPDVEWSTDEVFSSIHSPDWLFTHIRVTKLPPHLEKSTPLAFASPDQLGFAVAMALWRLSAQRPVAYYTGGGRAVTLNVCAGVPPANEADARSLFADYVPVGTKVLTSPHATDAIQ